MISKRHLFILFLIFSLSGFSQRAKADLVETENGKISIQPIQHGSLVITWNNITIYIDPTGSENAFEGISEPDLILITDIHGDHLNLKTLKAIETSKSKIIAPRAVADKLPPEYLEQVSVLQNGESLLKSGIEIEAIPMYNLPEDTDAFHPKGRGNGYLLNIDGVTLYISGDTEDIQEMRLLEHVDIAFICMNLPYTMSIEQAASAVLAFKPKIVYPYHYRGKNGKSNVESFKKLVSSENPAIAVRLRNWYPNP